MTATDRPAGAVPGYDWLTLACLLATGTFLGLTTNLAKLGAAAGVPALPFLAWSVTGSAIILLTRTAMTLGLPALTWRTAEYFVAAGLVSFAAPNLILFASVPHVGAGFAALILAFPPLFTYVGALALGIEKFDRARALGVALALSGAGVLAMYKFAAPDAATGWIVATLTVPVLLAIGNIYRTLRWPPGARADQLAPGMLAACAVMLLGFGLVTGTPLGFEGSGKIEAYLLIAAQAAAFAIQYVIYFILQKRGGPVYLSLIGSVAAVVGVPFAVLLLGEAWPAGIVTAAVLIGAGIWLVTGTRRR
jgi:drug/metabolite transporter (DMT)-like permease